MRPTNPNQRIWQLAAGMAIVGAVILALVDFPRADPPHAIPWWSLVPIFFLTDVLVIHLPTRRSAHTVSASEISLVLGLAFLAPHQLLLSRMLGGFAAYTLVRRQPTLKLGFNTALLMLDTLVAATVFHALLGSATPLDPRGWVAALGAVTASTALTGLMVSLAIRVHDKESSLRERGRQMYAGILISLGAGVIAVIWLFVVWNDVRAATLLVLSGVPIVLALKVYERLARRHDELGVAYELTKRLESCDTVEAVAEAALDRLVTVLMPAAAIVLMAGMEALSFVEEDGEEIAARDRWDETLRYHTDVCEDGDECACGRRVLGPEWEQGRTYRLTVGDQSRGMLIVRPRAGRGAEISGADDRMLKAIAAQLSSATTRIEALARMQREIEEKQALVRSKDQLIASVSHELRTPLTGIIGFAELLADSEQILGAEDAEHAKRYIAAEAHDLGNIVEDLLTAARADLGALEIQAQPVSTGTVVERSLTHMRDGSTIKVSGPDCWVIADAPRMRQILRNLLANAFKYGGTQVEVTTTIEDALVVITVSDDGVGVPEERAISIFEPYESAHDEPSQPGSLGLGLSISRSLARLMGGDLTYSRDGEWTRFHLALPAVAGVEPARDG